MASSSSESRGEEFDDTDDEEQEAESPFGGRIKRKKIDVPLEIMNMVKQYTTWQTMEDLDIAQTECLGVPCDSDTADFKIQLEKMDELFSTLNAYHFRYANYTDTLDRKVDKCLRRIVQLFPGIESMEAYNKLSKGVKYRIEETLEYKDFYGDQICLPDTADAERNLERMLGTLVSDMEKVRTASKLRVASDEVRSRVRSFMGTLEATVDRCSRFMENNGRGHKRMKLAEPAEEVPVSAEEKFQSLCKVMKKVLGARVEDVVVSDRFGSSSSCCCLRNSSKGGMTMEINPEDRLIKDLHKRLCTNNELHVKTTAVVLFNYAKASQRGEIYMDKLKMVQEQYCLDFGNARQRVQSCMDELKSIEDPSRVQSCMDVLKLAQKELMLMQDNYTKQVKSCMDELKMLQDQNLNLKMFQYQYLDLLEPVK